MSDAGTLTATAEWAIDGRIKRDGGWEDDEGADSQDAADWVCWLLRKEPDMAKLGGFKYQHMQIRFQRIDIDRRTAERYVATMLASLNAIEAVAA